MKKVFAFILSVLMLIAFSFVLVGCPSAPEKKPAEPAKKEAAAPAPRAPDTGTSTRSTSAWGTGSCSASSCGTSAQVISLLRLNKKTQPSIALHCSVCFFGGSGANQILQAEPCMNLILCPLQSNFVQYLNVLQPLCEFFNVLNFSFYLLTVFVFFHCPFYSLYINETSF